MTTKYVHLNDWERSRIMVLYASGSSIRAIALILRRSPSTISRELQRNGHKGTYSAHIAGERAKERKTFTNKQRKLWLCKRLKAYVIGRIKRGWSPELISGRLAKMIGKGSKYYISHEAIYASIYALPRGELRKEIISALRQSRKKRGARKHSVTSNIPDLRPISERPQEVQDRQMPGHWEGDLIKGPGNKSSIGTLVERTSRYLIMVKLDNATSEEVTSGFVRQLKPVPEHLLQTLTYDRGSEMTEHKRITKALNLDVYFADPHSPWQKGTVENTNGRIRYWLPKGCDLSTYSQEDLNEIARLINNTPRKCLDFRKPKEVFRQIAKNDTMRT